MSPNLKSNYFTRHPLAAVFLFVFICLFPAMLMRDFTPSNELRYLSIADEALSGRHFFAFFNHGVPYADKPPLYIWIVMLCKTIFGQHSVFALSMFSLLPAFVVTWVMDKWVMEGAPTTDRMSMAMMMLSCAMFLGTSIVLRMDMLMCMFIVLSLFMFWRMYDLRLDGEPEGNDAVVYKKCSWYLPICIFMALFTKGPVGLLVPPISIVVFLIAKRKWSDIGKYLGWKTWGVIFVICIIWFACVYADGGMTYLDNLLFKQTVGRAVNAFTHNKPIWYYAVALLWCIAPYTLLLIGSIVSSAFAKNIRSDKEILFLSVIASTFVMLSSFSSKLPVYLVPIFPFIVYLFPLVCSRTGARRWMAWAIGVPAAILAIAGLVVAIVAGGYVNVSAMDSLRSEYPFIFTGPIRIAAILLLVGNVLSLYFLLRRRQWNLPIFMIGSSMLLMIYSASGVLGKANAYIGYRDVCNEIPSETDVATLFIYRPENMDVYIGRQVRDYKKDTESFLKDAENAERPFTLVTTADKMESIPDLHEFSHKARTIAYVGPYCVITVKPIK